MATCESLSFLNCEIRIIRAKNLDFAASKGNLFVRYYLKTENNIRIRLNSREIRSVSDPYWNEAMSLECSGSEDAMEKLKGQTVVFELRWRKTASTGLLGKFGGSELLLRAEVAWKDVVGSAELSIEKWVYAATNARKCCVSEGAKPPALQIGMRVAMPEKAELVKRRRELMLRKCSSECGCRHGEYCSGGDDDLFFKVLI
ncbi:hypothetical protein Syun_003989 [Stephania yunnanensis]|uniref:C2 domain-containing protein n=1 Tax=Stephania yunnanensis TaxID=152371 RepID=A0AAP0Q0C2_9MAGN